MSRPGWGAALASLVVGGAFTAVSLYWALGGTALLDTVGGALEAQGRAGDAGILALVWASVALKAVASVLPVATLAGWGGGGGAGRGGGLRQWVRRAAWAAGVILTVYGGLLTGAGLLVVADVIPANADADLRAIRWHAFVWDPWFLVGGVLALTALLRSRRPPVPSR